MANACCSIELEPRTLRQGQLIHAREIAADVQKMEREEGPTLQIKEIRVAKEMDQIEENGHEEDKQKHDDDGDDNGSKEKGEVLESPCQCSVIPSNMESPDDQMIIKEPLSAPF